MNDLKRFLDAQDRSYPTALSEIRQGKKQSHWMWYIFPQIEGLGRSATSKFYAIKNIDEATAYLRHPVLGKRLIEISNVLLRLKNKNAGRIFGSPDDLKLKSAMTLFASLPDTDPVFQAVLDHFFNGLKDSRTLAIISRQQSS